MKNEQGPSAKQLAFRKSVGNTTLRTGSIKYPFLQSIPLNNHLLLTAVMRHDMKAIDKALKNEADINATNVELQTSLHHAVDSGSVRLIMKILSISGVRIDSRNQYGVTPLWVAAWHAKYEITNILLRRGADPNTKCTLNSTALHAAAYSQSYPIVKLLVNYGAEVNEKDCFGETPLQKAIEHFNTQIIRFLLLNGATFVRNDFPYFAQLVLSSRRKVFAKIVKLLVTYDIDLINYKNPINGMTILHYAAMNGDVDTIDALINLGGNVLAKDKYNIEPLTIAMVFRNYLATLTLKNETEKREFENLMYQSNTTKSGKFKSSRIRWKQSTFDHRHDTNT